MIVIVNSFNIQIYFSILVWWCFLFFYVKFYDDLVSILFLLDEEFNQWEIGADSLQGYSLAIIVIYRVLAKSWISNYFFFLLFIIISVKVSYSVSERISSRKHCTSRYHTITVFTVHSVQISYFTNHIGYNEIYRYLHSQFSLFFDIIRR